MSWFERVAPGLKKALSKRDTPDNLWVKCPATGDMVFTKDLEAACHVTPAGHHMRIGPDERFAYTFDGGEVELIELPSVPRDPLRFKDDKTYASRLGAARKKTGREDAVAVGVGKIDGLESVLFVQDFAFMGGSLGMAAGEGFVTAAETAVARKAPLVGCIASGGARMQEAMLSLMQMPRTILAVQDLKAAGLPYVVVLTDPTTGGVTASYAMIGDVHLAEPGALIGFAGPRVIEQTIRETLPEGFQRSEYLLDKGMVDMVVDRRQLKQTLSSILRILMGAPRATASTQAKLNGAAHAHGAARPNGAAKPNGASGPSVTTAPAEPDASHTGGGAHGAPKPNGAKPSGSRATKPTGPSKPGKDDAH